VVDERSIKEKVAHIARRRGPPDKSGPLACKLIRKESLCHTDRLIRIGNDHVEPNRGVSLEINSRRRQAWVHFFVAAGFLLRVP